MARCVAIVTEWRISQPDSTLQERAAHTRYRRAQSLWTRTKCAAGSLLAIACNVDADVTCPVSAGTGFGTLSRDVSQTMLRRSPDKAHHACRIRATRLNAGVPGAQPPSWCAMKRIGVTVAEQIRPLGMQASAIPAGTRWAANGARRRT